MELVRAAQLAPFLLRLSQILSLAFSAKKGLVSQDRLHKRHPWAVQMFPAEGQDRLYKMRGKNQSRENLRPECTREDRRAKILSVLTNELVSIATAEVRKTKSKARCQAQEEP